MNVDTDTQWAYWEGLKTFYDEKKDYLQCQIGNPDGPDAPNKKYYDPRVWTRKSEESMMKRAGLSMEKLGCAGTYEPKIPADGSLAVFPFTPLKPSAIAEMKKGFTGLFAKK